MTNFPLETILKTLARVLLVAKEKKLTEHYQTAKALLDKITTMMNLQYRDIAVLTTGAAELELYQQLNNYHQNPDENGPEKLLLPFFTILSLNFQIFQTWMD